MSALIEELKAEVKRAENAAKASDNTLTIERGTVSSLTELVEKLRIEATSKETTEHAIQQRIDENEKELQDLRQKLHAQVHELNAAASLKENLIRAESTEQRLSTELLELQRKLGREAQRAENSERKLEAQREEVARLMSDIASKNDNAVASQRTIQELKQTLHTESAKVTKLEAQLNRVVSEQKKEHAAVERLSKELQMERGAQTMLQAQVAEMRAELGRERADSTKTSRRLIVERTCAKSLRKQLALLVTSNEARATRMQADLEDALDKKSKVDQQLLRESARLVEERKESQRLARELTKLRAGTEQQLDMATSEAARLRGEIEKERTAKAQSDEDLTTARNETARLRAELESQGTKADEVVKSLTDERERLKSEREALALELRKVRTDLDNSTKSSTGLQATLDQERAKAHAKGAQFTEALHEREAAERALKGEVATLEEEVEGERRKLENTRATVVSQKTQLNILAKQVMRQRGHLDQQLIRISLTAEEKERDAVIIQDLTRELSSLRELLSARQAESETITAALRADLLQSNSGRAALERERNTVQRLLRDTKRQVVRAESEVAQRATTIEELRERLDAQEREADVLRERLGGLEDVLDVERRDTTVMILEREREIAELKAIIDDRSMAEEVERRHESERSHWLAEKASLEAQMELLHERVADARVQENDQAEELRRMRISLRVEQESQRATELTLLDGHLQAAGLSDGVVASAISIRSRVEASARGGGDAALLNSLRNEISTLGGRMDAQSPIQDERLRRVRAHRDGIVRRLLEAADHKLEASRTLQAAELQERLNAINAEHLRGNAENERPDNLFVSTPAERPAEQPEVESTVPVPQADVSERIRLRLEAIRKARMNPGPPDQPVPQANVPERIRLRLEAIRKARSTTLSDSA
jgi:hypothetical protein